MQLSHRNKKWQKKKELIFFCCFDLISFLKSKDGDNVHIKNVTFTANASSPRSRFCQPESHPSVIPWSIHIFLLEMTSCCHWIFGCREWIQNQKNEILHCHPVTPLFLPSRLTPNGTTNHGCFYLKLLVQVAVTKEV